MSSRPPRLVCPLCARDDEVSVVPLGPGLWEFTCAAGAGHSGAFRWQSTTAKDAA